MEKTATLTAMDKIHVRVQHEARNGFVTEEPLLHHAFRYLSH